LGNLSANNIAITFHDIHSRDWLRRTLQAIASRYDFVSIDEVSNFYHSGKTLKNTCHITFDDGHKTFYENSFPVLKELGIPASIYVSPLIIIEEKNFWFQEIAGIEENHFKQELALFLQLEEASLARFSIYAILKSLPVDDIHAVIDQYFTKYNRKRLPPQNMNTDQLIEVDRSGLIKIGAHTMNHPILKNETDERAYDEVKASIDGLARLLGKKTAYFAFPNGIPLLDFGPREQKILADCDVSLSFSMEKKRYSQADHHLAVPRNALERGGPNLVKLKLLLGKSWYQLKNRLTPANEISQRIHFQALYSTNRTTAQP